MMRVTQGQLSGLAQDMTPVYSTAPGLPSGYQTATPEGVIPSNPTGTTTVVSASGDVSDVLAQSEAMNAANLALCQQQGGTWNAASGTCGTNWTPLLMVGALAIGLLVLLKR